jgi:hypothetical protein
MHPAVKRGRPFFATGTWFDSHRVRNSFDDIAQTYLFLFDETRETNTMNLVRSCAWWFFLLFATHSFVILPTFNGQAFC